jgi:hypothetical protein
MAEMSKSKRVKFSKNKQKVFLTKTKNVLKLKNKDLAKLLKISNRTLTDWKREKFYISLEAAKLLSRKTGIKISKNIKILEPFWYAKKGARAGGITMYKKYGSVGGNPEIRKKKWHKWWELKGKFNPNSITNKIIEIHKPYKSAELAEFAGIMLGDGGISKYQIKITLNHISDKPYSKFVFNLIKKLFKTKPIIYYYPQKSILDITLSRREIVKFCVEKIGLKIGNKIKQKIDIPSWINQNRKFQIACLRGLIDTDGSIFTHTYRVNKKWYSYKKLDFSSSSEPLRQSVYNIFIRIGLNPRLAQNKSVRLDSIEDMIKYFSIVGSHNPKHLKRYSK